MANTIGNMLPAPDQRQRADGLTEDEIDRRMQQYANQTLNRFGCTPRLYEHGSRWVKYECRCGNMFWSMTTPSQTRNCRQAGKECRVGGEGASSAQLQLHGKEWGSIKVIGHERGKGWKIRCRCGRERYIISGTALATGAFKTCGQCTEEERHRNWNTIATLAPPTGNVKTGAGTTCEDGHRRINYRAHEDGCPLCLALARIEIIELEVKR